MKLAALLKKWLGEDTAAQDPAAQRRLAAAVLLLEIARADFALAEPELATIRASLSAQFGLSEQAAGELLAAAEAEHADSTCLSPYVRVFNTQATREEKRELLAALWRVAHADGVLDQYEEHTMRRIADMLYLSHADFIRTKLAVAEA